MADLVEVAVPLFGFWLYVFSPRFRRYQNRAWREEAVSAWGKVSIEIDITIALVVGLGGPVLVLWWIVG